MTAEMFAAFTGAVLSLAFSYVPGLAPKFEALEPVYKRLIMLALLVATAVVVYGLACLGWAGDFGLAVSCDKAGAVELVKALLFAIMANQTVYALSPKR